MKLNSTSNRGNYSQDFQKAPMEVLLSICHNEQPILAHPSPSSYPETLPLMVGNRPVFYKRGGPEHGGSGTNVDIMVPHHSMLAPAFLGPVLGVYKHDIGRSTHNHLTICLAKLSVVHNGDTTNTHKFEDFPLTLVVPFTNIHSSQIHLYDVR